MRIFIFLLLVLAAPFALADPGSLAAGIGSQSSGTGLTGSIFTVPNMDQSVMFLSEIFGQVGSVLGGATNGPLEQAILLFNNIALVMGGFVILYTVVVSTINTAHDGEMLGKDWSSVWIPLRAAGGFSLLLPVKAGGYAFCQVFVMWVVLQGVGAADYIWGMYLKNVEAGNATPQIPYISQTVMTNVAAIFQNAACTVGLANLYNQTESGVPGFQPVTPVISYPPATTPTGDSISFSASGMMKGACGSITMQAVPTTTSDASLGNQIRALQSANAQQSSTSGFAPVQNNNAYSAKVSAVNSLRAGFQGAATSSYAAQQATHANQVLINITQQLNTAATYYVQKSNYCNGNTDKGCVNDIQKQIINAANSYVNQTSGAGSPVASGSNQFSRAAGAVMSDLNQARQYGWLYAGAYYILLSKITGATTTEDVAAPQVTTIQTNIKTYSSTGGLPSTYIQSDQLQYIKQVTAMCKHTSVGVNSTAIQSSDGTYTQGAGPLVVPCIPPNLNTAGPAATLNLAYVTSSGAQSGPFAAVITLISAFFVDLLNWFVQKVLIGGGNPVLSLAGFGQAAVAGGTIVFGSIAISVPIIAFVFGLAPFSVGGAFDSGISNLVQILLFPILGALGLAVGVGATAGFYLPLVPYILFTAGSLAWFILVIEAMIAAPIVALGIVHPEGQHKIWGRGEKGIMIIVSIFLRPALMVVGFIAASLLVYVAFQILNGGFKVAVVFIGQDGFGPFTFVFSLVAYISMAVYLMHQCFKLIHKIPDNIMRWIGEAAESTGQEADQEVTAGGQKVSGGAEGGMKATQEAGKDKFKEAQTAAAAEKGLAAMNKAESRENQTERDGRGGI